MDTRPLNVRTEYQDLPLNVIKKIQSSLTNNLSVLLFNVRTDGNVGMIIRQACLMGCRRVIICGKKQYDRRFTVGSHHYIDIEFWDKPLIVNTRTVSPGVFKETVDYDPQAFIDLCKTGNYTPVFLEQGGMDIQQIKWQTVENPLLVLGNESLGIPQTFINVVKKRRCLFVSIPQSSVIRSMNVAMAGSIAIWEMVKNVI